MRGDPGDRLQSGEMRLLSVERVATRFEGGIATYEKRYVSVGDISERSERLRLNSEIDIWDQKLKLRPDWVTPSKDDNFQTTNPAFDWFYGKNTDQSSILHWRNELMPYAPALYPLQVPEDAGRLFPGGMNDERSQDIFLNADDAIAIRARAVILGEAGIDLIVRSPKDTFVGLSLGAGAGVPDLNFMKKAYDQYGATIFMDMIDFQQRALDFGADLANERGIPVNDEAASDVGHISMRRADYRLPFPNKNKGGKPESYDMVEMLGLWEYLDRDGCVEAIRESYALLKPGGILVVSNMRTDRPQLDFFKRGIAWPGVEPRSEEEIVAIAIEASVRPEDIIITVSQDGVYSVMEIRKP
ncbi:MAG TPA: class I SAM-dependent methyltransferase [Candidatus Microsaccharimonas sp.]|jgi:SAM-dependent methyltransferase